MFWIRVASKARSFKRGRVRGSMIFLIYMYIYMYTLAAIGVCLPCPGKGGEAYPGRWSLMPPNPVCALVSLSRKGRELDVSAMWRRE